MITIYSKTHCPFCIKAKKLFDKNDIEYTEIVLDNAEDRQNFITKYPDAKTVPQIFVNNKRIGGYDDLLKLTDNGTDMSFLFNQ